MAAAVTAVVGIYSAFKQQKLAKQQAKVAKEQEQARVRMSQIEAQRERIRSQREARIKTADIINSSATSNIGLGGSSGVVGGVGSVASQEASNQAAINTQLDFSNRMGNLNNKMSDLQYSSAKLQFGTQMVSGAAGLGKTIFDMTNKNQTSSTSIWGAK